MTGLLCTDIYLCKITEAEWIPTNTKTSGSNKKALKDLLCLFTLKFTPLLSPIICSHLFFFFHSILSLVLCSSFSFHTPSVTDLLSSHSLHFTFIPIIEDLLISLHVNFSFSHYSKAFFLYIFIFCYSLPLHLFA